MVISGHDKTRLQFRRGESASGFSPLQIKSGNAGGGWTEPSLSVTHPPPCGLPTSLTLNRRAGIENCCKDFLMQAVGSASAMVDIEVI
ncbi:MAG: hypothetical protein M3552_11620, partial [Planctomycetota bacterium]|nr:hypothetical protein [Planctomycetota bacterium]